MGVKEISQFIQETLNTEDAFTICDPKGIELQTVKKQKVRILCTKYKIYNNKELIMEVLTFSEKNLIVLIMRLVELFTYAHYKNYFTRCEKFIMN